MFVVVAGESAIHCGAHCEQHCELHCELQCELHCSLYIVNHIEQCSVEVVGVGRDQYFRSWGCSSMPSPSILGRDDEHNHDKEGAMGYESAGGWTGHLVQEVEEKGGEV